MVQFFSLASSFRFRKILYWTKLKNKIIIKLKNKFVPFLLKFTEILLNCFACLLKTLFFHFLTVTLFLKISI